MVPVFCATAKSVKQKADASWLSKDTLASAVDRIRRGTVKYHAVEVKHFCESQISPQVAS